MELLTLTTPFLVQLIRLIPIAERILRPKISGRWYFEYLVRKSSYNPYNGMRVQYVAQLLCERSGRITGTSEKLQDRIASGAVRTYTGKHRDRAEVVGEIVFAPSERTWIVSLHIKEQGHEREHSATQNLRPYDDGDKMKGTFTGTAADSEGEVLWKRDAFLNLS